MKAKELFSIIAENGYKSITECSNIELIIELERISALFDDFELHNHNIVDAADQGWFILRDVLMEAASRLEQ